MSQDKPVLPCPFCGNEPEEIKRYGVGELGEHPEPSIRCSSGKCGARYVPGGFPLSEWNHRAIERQGWISVPREATPEMLEAGFDPMGTGNPLHVYRAMLAAAPHASAQINEDAAGPASGSPDEGKS